MRIRELRANAREDAQGNKWNLVWPLFIVAVIAELLGIIPSLIPDKTISLIITLVFAIAAFILGISASYAIAKRYIKIARKEEVPSFFSDVFGEGIRNGFSAVWGVFKKTWYWYLMVILGYVMMFGGAIGAIGSKSFNYTDLSTLHFGAVSLIGILLVFIGAIFLMLASFHYYLVMFLKCDYPEKDTNELVNKSKEMMYGNKAKAFVIYLTFIGWMFLTALITAIVGVIFEMIWPSQMVFGMTVPTMPTWATILLSIISCFISSFVAAYIMLTNVEFYFERKPLEIYNEDYVKPEINSSKYIKIIVLIFALIILVPIALGVIIYSTGVSLTNNAINLLDMLQHSQYPNIY